MSIVTKSFSAINRALGLKPSNSVGAASTNLFRTPSLRPVTTKVKPFGIKLLSPMVIGMPKTSAVDFKRKPIFAKCLPEQTTITQQSQALPQIEKPVNLLQWPIGMEGFWHP